MKRTSGSISLGLAIALTPAALLLPAPAQAQAVIYCCNDAEGRKQCGDFLPKACQKRAYEERDGKGYIIKKVDAPLTAEQQAKRDAELAKNPDALLGILAHLIKILVERIGEVVITILHVR